MAVIKKSSVGAPASVLDLLQRDASIRALLPAADRILDIQKDLRRCLPAQLARDCEVCGLEEGNLVVRVSSNSVASKLRQLVPGLAEALTRKGWNINAIRLRVQPANSASESERKPEKRNATMPASAIARFKLLAETLEPSPLRSALETAVRRRADHVTKP